MISKGENIETTVFFNRPVCNPDLGALGRGMFTQKKRFKIDELSPRQIYVCEETINYKMKGRWLTTPCIVVSKKETVLIDGHHTVIAKMLNGQKYVYALYYTID